MCDYRSVEIERGVGGSFGFSLIGGIDTELPPMICALVHNGSAQLSGKIQVGDVLVEVNGECVSRLPAKKVVETVKFSPDVLKLRLRKDPEAAARARPYLRKHSVQDPRLQQFQRKVLRRSASLPSRAKRPVLPSHRKAETPGPRSKEEFSMPKSHLRILGEPVSPTGIDRGTDGTFRKRVGSRSGSFSKITTSFPAHGGPPCTTENNERMTMSSKGLSRAASEINCRRARKSSLQSSSLPEITKATNQTALLNQRSLSSNEALLRRTVMQRSRRGSNNNDSKVSITSLPAEKTQSPHDMKMSMTSSPYTFEKHSTDEINITTTWNGIEEDNNKLLSNICNKTTAGSNDIELNKQKDVKTSKNTAAAGVTADELARRLFYLEGYRSQDVAPMLYKNNDFSKTVAVHFMALFNFNDQTLVESLRKLLSKFTLTGETQERERILIAFSNRYYECNKPDYGTADAVHTLVCAIMLLNTDLHGEQTMGRRMKIVDFIKNLSNLCDGKDFPTDLLKDIYTEIKTKPLQFCSNETEKSLKSPENVKTNGQITKTTNVVDSPGSLALMGYQTAGDDVIYKEGLLYRKMIEEAGGKKTSAWRRGWQPFYATLRGMILFLHKPDESRDFDDTRFSLGAHHCFASAALDYTKKPGVFRFITADWKVMLLQARDKKDMTEWVEALNLVSATFSSPPLPAPVGSCKKFQKPVLPFSRTKLTVTEQLASHEKKAQEMADVLIEHLQGQPQPSEVRQRLFDEWSEKRDFLDYEYKRYRSYANILKSSKLQAQIRERSASKSKKLEKDTVTKRNGILSNNIKRYSSLNDLLDAVGNNEEKHNPNYRQSYFMAIYKG